MGKNSHYATGDPELEAIIQTIISSRPPPNGPFEVNSVRAGYNQIIDDRIKSFTFDKVSMIEFQIPVEGGSITAFHYIPIESANTSTTFPLLLNFHEGGHIGGKAAMDHAFCSSLCTNVGLSVLNVDYRLAPEFPFPICVEDSYAALKWAVDNTTKLRADLNKGLFVSGASAGGNISAALTLRARDDPSFQARITGQILNYPELYSKLLHPIEKYKEDLTSIEEETNDPIVPKPLLDFVDGIYDKPLTHSQQSSPDRSPLLAPSLAHLPPAFIFVCGKDPLRDEGILYGKLLEEANSGTGKVHVYPNAFHAFLGVVPDSGAAKKLMNDLIHDLKSLVGA